MHHLSVVVPVEINRRLSFRGVSRLSMTKKLVIFQWIGDFTQDKGLGTEEQKWLVRNQRARKLMGGPGEGVWSERTDGLTSSLISQKLDFDPDSMAFAMVFFSQLQASDRFGRVSFCLLYRNMMFVRIRLPTNAMALVD